MHPIIEPQTKPATEWIAGRAVQKVSPTERHASAQARIVAALIAWADEFKAGRVGTEWEFRVSPPGECTRSLVPDVAYLSYERLPFDQDAAAQIPRGAPNVAFEVLSPNDRQKDVDEKIRVYLASGTELVVIVDPETKNVALHDAGRVCTLHADDTIAHRAMPGFELRLAAIFAKSGER